MISITGKFIFFLKSLRESLVELSFNSIYKLTHYIKSHFLSNQIKILNTIQQTNNLISNCSPLFAPNSGKSSSLTWINSIEVTFVMLLKWAAHLVFLWFLTVESLFSTLSLALVEVVLLFFKQFILSRLRFLLHSSTYVLIFVLINFLRAKK